MELKIQEIWKKFSNKEVLRNISFTATSGQVLGYLGRNGAGKTTTIRILMDIFRPDSGKILLNGTELHQKGRSKVSIGYLPEERGLYPRTKISDQMIYIGELRGMTRAAAKKSAMALLEELEATEYWSKKLDNLSKGNQQKIQLAISVLHNPDIIILDEPFSGLDPVNSNILKRLILKEVNAGKIVLFSSHQMPYVEEFCEHICIINQGEIVVNGKISDIKRSYPRNRLVIAPERNAEEFDKLIAGNSLIATSEIKGDEIELTLKNPEDKAELFRILAGLPIGFDKLHVVEPTLEEIFVEKTGDLNA